MDEVKPHRPWWVPALLLVPILGSVLLLGVRTASSQPETETATECWDEYQTELGPQGNFFENHP